MTRIGYHASHEQYAPGRLLGLVRRAERAGFQSAMCSDHFHPWTARQGESGFAWSWLGAALGATDLPFGVVNAPVGRYHPAVIAQAAATLADLYPGRFWLAVGSGEALNEGITGEPWPDKAARNERLLAAVEVIRALWAGECVTRDGPVRVEGARLYSLPERAPMLVGAALSPETARWMGGWADGLITVAADRETIRAVVEAFREGGGAGKPLFLQAQLSFADTYDEALTAAWDQWRAPLLPSEVLGDIPSPEAFAEASAGMTREDVAGKIRVSADPDEHLQWLREDLELGFAEINLHNVCRESQERFIDVFGERVLPALRAR